MAASSETAGLPEWIELIPAQGFSGRDGRGPYHMANPGAVIAATEALRMDAGLPIDYDHATDFGAPEGRPAPAAGWIKELAVREGAIWGRVEWTTHGGAALKTREYRYISPVFEHDESGEVVRLLRAALTNNPNLYVKAIAARHSDRGERASAADGADEATEIMGNLLERDLTAGLAELRTMLGLNDEATAGEIVAAVSELVGGAETRDEVSSDSSKPAPATSAAEPHRAGFVSMKHFQQTTSAFNRLRAEHQQARVEQAVSAAMQAGKLAPAQREWALEYCSGDYAGFEAFVARQPALALSRADFDGYPRTAGRANRRGEDGAVAAGGLSTVERAVCGMLGIRQTDYCERKGRREECAEPDALQGYGK